MSIYDDRHGGWGSKNNLLELIIRGGLVKRYHTRDTIKDETVAQHSFYVAWFCYILFDAIGRKPSASLLICALAHDLPEWWGGDVPSPTKDLPGIGDKMEAMEESVLAEAKLTLPELTLEEERLLKLADCLSGLLFCAMEARRGNILRTGYYDYLVKLTKTPAEVNILNAVIRVYNHAVYRDASAYLYRELEYDHCK